MLTKRPPNYYFIALGYMYNALKAFEAGNLIQVRKHLTDMRLELKDEAKLPDHIIWRSVQQALAHLDRMPEQSVICLHAACQIAQKLALKRNLSTSITVLEDSAERLPALMPEIYNNLQDFSTPDFLK